MEQIIKNKRTLNYVSMTFNDILNDFYLCKIDNQNLAKYFYDSLLYNGYLEVTQFEAVTVSHIQPHDLRSNKNTLNIPTVYQYYKIFKISPITKRFFVGFLRKIDNIEDYIDVLFPIYEDYFFLCWDFKFVMVEKSRYICKT